MEMHVDTSSGEERLFGHDYYHSSYPISAPPTYEDKRIGVSWSDDEHVMMSRQPQHLHHEQQEPIEPHEHDVLMGRGGRNNQHSGNEILRQFARVQKEKYQTASKKGKSALSRLIVRQMRELDPPARFLKRLQDTGAWEEVGDDTAREKASQVLRDAVAGLFEDRDVSPIALSTTVASVSAPVTREEHERQYASRGRASIPRPDNPHSRSDFLPPHHRHHHSEPPSAKRRRHSSQPYARYDPRYSLSSSTQVVDYSPIRRHSEESYHPSAVPSSDQNSQHLSHLNFRQQHHPVPYQDRGHHSEPNLDEFDLLHGDLLDSDLEEEAQAHIARQTPSGNIRRRS